jgi:hypothetical protein
MTAKEIERFTGIYTHHIEASNPKGVAIVRTCLKYCWIRTAVYDEWRVHRFGSSVPTLARSGLSRVDADIKTAEMTVGLEIAGSDYVLLPDSAPHQKAPARAYRALLHLYPDKRVPRMSMERLAARAGKVPGYSYSGIGRDEVRRALGLKK